MNESAPPQSSPEPLNPKELLKADPARKATVTTWPAPWMLRNALLLSGVLAALCAILATALTLAQPWLGLRLTVDDGEVRIAYVYPGSPAFFAAVPANATLLTLESPDGAKVLTLEPYDLLEDPDELPSYRAWGRFYERQDRAVALLSEPKLVLRLASAGQVSTVEVQPAGVRPMASLPFAYWFQMVVAGMGLIAAGWALSVYPLQPATWYAGASALTLQIMVLSAAVNGSRELAMPSTTMHALSVANHVSTLLTLFGLTGVISTYPLHISPQRSAVVVTALLVYVLCGVADALWWLPSPNWSYRAMMSAAVLILLIQVLRQLRACEPFPRERAAARALSVPWVLGPLFVLGLQELPVMLGYAPLLAQSWVMASTVVVSVGGAVALRSRRVFDLDEWALQVLLVWGAGIGALACHQIVSGIGLHNPAVGILLALLVFGVLYVPFTNWIWRHFVIMRGPPPREVTGGILALSLSQPADRPQRWASLLGQAFRARRVEWGGRPAAGAQDQVRIMRGGKALFVPPVAGLPGMVLWDRERGVGAFSRSDERLAERLHELVRMTIEVRDAYGRGAAEERERIANDLHDDLGAKLLSLVHASTPGRSEEMAELAREALDEMRLAVRNLKQQPALLTEVLADWRAECVSRLSAAGIQIDWDAEVDGGDAVLLPARVSMHLTRVVREAITNVIRHSGATHCLVRLKLADAELKLRIEDDGRGIDPGISASSTGLGLANIERRVRRLGGDHRFSAADAGGLVLSVRVPVGHLFTEHAKVSGL